MTVPSPTTGYLPEHHGRRRVTKPRASEDGSASSSTSSDSESEEDSVYSDSASSDDLEQLAQREWEENVRQLQLAVSVLIMPTLGKWLGRRWAYGSE